MIYRSVHSLNSTLFLQLKEIRDYKRNDLTPGQAPRAEESEEEESEVEEEEEEEEEQDVSQEEEEVCAVNCCSPLFIHAISKAKPTSEGLVRGVACPLSKMSPSNRKRCALQALCTHMAHAL